MTGAGLLSKDGSYILKLQLRLRFLLDGCLSGLRLDVVSGKLLVEPVCCRIN